jgi:Alpha/beta hydrolase of unknown function (DUF1400)
VVRADSLRFQVNVSLEPGGSKDNCHPVTIPMTNEPITHLLIMMSRLIGTTLSIGIGVGAMLFSLPAACAERIYLKYGPLMFSLPLEALATYVHEGRITPSFALYAHQVDAATLSQLRQMLQQSYEMDEVAVYRMTQTPIVEDLLRYLGELITTPSGVNGFYAIRSALVLAAAEPGNWTMMDVMRHFPTDLRINVDRAQSLLNSTQSPDAAPSPAVFNESFNLLY